MIMCNVEEVPDSQMTMVNARDRLLYLQMVHPRNQVLDLQHRSTPVDDCLLFLLTYNGETEFV